jgi:ribosome-binding ATPase
MKLGLVGFPQVGKRTLFRLLTGIETLPEGGGAKGGLPGLARVRDVRFDRLVELYRPKKETPATTEFLLLPDLDTQPERNAQALRVLEQVDAICHLVRVFEDETVFHIEGSVDPRRDIRRLNEELQLSDLLFLEKRLERLQKEKGKSKDAPKAALEADLLGRMRSHLDQGRFLASFPLTDDEEKILASYPLLTRKSMILLLNVGENQLGDAGLVSTLAEEFKDLGFQWIAVSARIEQELSLLDEEERQAFLDELHLDQPALDRLTLQSYRALGLISFFTVGPDEVRAWTIRQGTFAPGAARAIHSDIERGFIRAEVMKYADLAGLGTEQKVREAGKFLLKGRDYVVEDGDIINFLFNV